MRNGERSENAGSELPLRRKFFSLPLCVDANGHKCSPAVVDAVETSKAEVDEKPVAPPKAPIVTQIVSNAHGPYPQVEMVSVPRRHNTHPGHGTSSRRPVQEGVADTLASRALNRISRRLGDVRMMLLLFELSFTDDLVDGFH